MQVPLADGRWVDEKFAHLAEIVHDYDHHLELRWIPPEQRSTKEEKALPYAVVDTRTNKIVMVAGELDNPVDVLTHLFEIDNLKGDVLGRMDSRNKALEAFRLKKELDEREEMEDKIAWIVGTKRNYVKMDGHKFDGDTFRRLD